MVELTTHFIGLCEDKIYEDKICSLQLPFAYSLFIVNTKHQLNIFFVPAGTKYVVLVRVVLLVLIVNII